MKKLIVAGSLAIASVASQAAPLVDVDAGIGVWMQSTGGTLLGDPGIDLGSDGLGLKGQSNMYFYLDVAHPIFILPDFKIRRQTLIASGNVDALSALSGDFADFDLGSFSTSAEVSAELDLSYTDIILNYGLPVPTVNIDFGLNFRMINGSFSMNDNLNAGLDESGPIKLLIPMAHVAVEYEVPGLGLYIGGEYNSLPIGDSSITDYTVKAKYFIPLPTNMVMKLGIEAGYHSFSMKVADKTLGTDTSEVASDITAKGVFLGATLKF